MPRERGEDNYTGWGHASAMIQTAVALQHRPEIELLGWDKPSSSFMFDLGG